MIDLHGATWVSQSEYELQPSARRYEFYERDFAGVVRGISALVHCYLSCVDCIRFIAESMRTHECCAISYLKTFTQICQGH